MGQFHMLNSLCSMILAIQQKKRMFHANLICAFYITNVESCHEQSEIIPYPRNEALLVAYLSRHLSGHGRIL